MSQEKTDNNLFLVLDGLDGVGKSTVAKLLAQRIGGIYYSMPPTVFTAFKIDGELSLRSYIDSKSNAHGRFLFYLMSAVYASDEIRQMLAQSHVVCDRYMASTIAYHCAMDVGLRDFDISQLDILRPDYQFLLEVDNEQERLRRIGNRQKFSVTDQLLEENLELLKRVKSEFHRLNMIKISTEGISAEMVSDLIYQRIKQKL